MKAQTSNDPNDRVALTLLGRLFADTEVVGINCTESIWGLGALHCMTQQQPREWKRDEVLGALRP